MSSSSLRRAHAAHRCAAVRDLLVALGHPLPEQWIESLVHRLKHEGPDGVLKELEHLYQEVGKPEAMGEHVRYLRKREACMQYPAFQQAGWPIGSGMVESGNKRAHASTSRMEQECIGNQRTSIRCWPCA